MTDRMRLFRYHFLFFKQGLIILMILVVAFGIFVREELIIIVIIKVFRCCIVTGMIGISSTSGRFWLAIGIGRF